MCTIYESPRSAVSTNLPLFSLLYPNTLLKTSIKHTASLHLISGEGNKVSNQYKTQGKMLLLSILKILVMTGGTQPASKHYDAVISSFLLSLKEKLGKLRKLTDQKTGCMRVRPTLSSEETRIMTVGRDHDLCTRN
jgi:hypothetical protein